MQLSPQFQQLPFNFFLLERLSEFHTSVNLVEACLGPQWKNSETSILRHRRLIRSVLCLTSSVLFLSLTWNLLVFWFIAVQNLMVSIPNHPVVHGRNIADWVVKFKNLHQRLDSYESGAQVTMNKDLRFARKGVPTGFGHGRRHSCLGYVPQLYILHLFTAYIHEREYL